MIHMTCVDLHIYSPIGLALHIPSPSVHRGWSIMIAIHHMVRSVKAIMQNAIEHPYPIVSCIRMAIKKVGPRQVPQR